jgi:hypothetical protein
MRTLRHLEIPLSILLAFTIGFLIAGAFPG